YSGNKSRSPGPQNPLKTKQGKRTLSPNIVSHFTEKRKSELLFCEIKLDCKNRPLNVEQKDWTLKSSE
ncbi:unnamed protein product, partial [Porites evermanni]